MMEENVIEQIYKNDQLLFYLRTNPTYYKKLERNPDGYKTFESTAKNELKITFYHRLEDLKQQISIMSMFFEYFNKD